jgi:hypothetical protein
MTDQPADDVRPAPDVRPEPDEPLQQHGDPLLAAAEGKPQGEGSRHGHPAGSGREDSDDEDSTA